MRILYCTRSDSPHDLRFLKALVSSGHEIYVLRLEESPTQPLTPAGVHQVDWQALQKPFQMIDLYGLLPRFAKILDEIKPDVIHAGPIQDVAALVAASGFHPLVSMSWGFDMMADVDKSELMQKTTAYTLKRTDFLVADCQCVIEKAKTFGFPPEKTVVFPWGVDLTHFSRANGAAEGKKLRKALGWEDKFVVLGLRSWEPKYGMEQLAQAFVKAAQQQPDLRLLLLGDGSQQQLIYGILQQGNVLDQVYFGGRVGLDELPRNYCAADVYVTPSHVDGSSVSLLEAMACQLPSIVTDIPGNLEWVEHGLHGWVYQDGDIEALSSSILDAFKSSQLDQMGTAARAKVEQDANWFANFPKLIDAYQSLVRS